MSDAEVRRPPVFAGRIGVTLLCIYLLGVTARIGGCYAPELARRDDLPGAAPPVGDTFPAFTLRDASGIEIRSDVLRGTPAVIAVVPSLDWSPPTKARVLDLADAVAGRRDVRVALLLPSAQATPRSLAFVRDRRLPFYVLVDDAGLIQRLGLATPAPDGTPAAFAATFVLDAEGRVVLRDVRKTPRAWPDADLVLAAALTPPGKPAP
jgi:peroxiredoxin